MRELGSATTVARRLGISRWTVYRYLESPLEKEMPVEVKKRD